MKHKFSKYVPAGLNPEKELYFFFWGLFFSFLFSLGGLNRYYELKDFLLNDLVKYPGQSSGVLSFLMKTYSFHEPLMPDFVTILDNALIGFFILALCMLLLAVYHYFYHFWGSRSIYLMRRLPHRYELLKRCLALPITAALSSLLCAFLLLLLYYGIYMLSTPKQYLPPDQWQKIWNILIIQP